MGEIFCCNTSVLTSGIYQSHISNGSVSVQFYSARLHLLKTYLYLYIILLCLQSCLTNMIVPNMLMVSTDIEWGWWEIQSDGWAALHWWSRSPLEEHLLWTIMIKNSKVSLKYTMWGAGNQNVGQAFHHWAGCPAPKLPFSIVLKITVCVLGLTL